MLKRGTRIETLGFPAMGGYAAVEPEQCRIVRYEPNVTKRADDRWYIVRYPDGRQLCMHESRFRVISN